MRIAICVRGSLRSWDVCKHNIFQTFKNFPAQIDWFFDTWDIDAYTYYEIFPNDNTCKAKRVELELDLKTEANIKIDFKNANMRLVSFEIHKFDNSLNPAMSFLKLIYLSNCSKRKVELMSNMRYDVVIQIRPDTVFKPILWREGRYVENIIASAKSYGINYSDKAITPGLKLRTFNEIDINDRYETIVSDVPGIPDFAFYGPSQVMDLLSSAYLDAKEKEAETRFCFPHATLFKFLQRNGVIMYDNFIDVMIVRNMKIDGKYDYDYFKDNPDEVLEFSESFCTGVDSCSDIWYDLYDRFKII